MLHYLHTEAQASTLLVLEACVDEEVCSYFEGPDVSVGGRRNEVCSQYRLATGYAVDFHAFLKPRLAWYTDVGNKGQPLLT